MSKKVVAIIQARMGSSRLPGKIMKTLGHMPALEWMIKRAGRAKLIDQIVIATTNDPSDDAVAEFCQANDYDFYRGSMQDVLDRMYQAAKENQAEVVVRLTGDCPFIDPDMLDSNLKIFLNAKPRLDFAANRLPPPFARTIPIGLDAEYCYFSGLETVWKEAKEKHQREHVMPFFYDHPDRFKILHIEHQPNHGDKRWTIDTPEDLKLIREIIKRFNGRDNFSWQEILQLIEENPKLSDINKDIRHKNYQEVE